MLGKAGSNSKYHVATQGGLAVGKTSLLQQLTTGACADTRDARRGVHYRKRIQVDDEVCEIDIVEALEQFKDGRREMIEQTDGFLLVYSVLDRESFERLQTYYIREIQRIKGGGAAGEMPVVLVGNFYDRVAGDQQARQVAREDGEELARQWNVTFFETSATENVNVSEAFTELVRRMRLYRLSHPRQEEASTFGCSLM